MRGLKLKKILTSKDMYYMLLLLVWTNDIMLHYFQAVLRRTPFVSGIQQEMIVLAVGILALGAMPYISKKIKLRDVFLYFAFCFVYLLSYYLTDSIVVETYLRSTAFQILAVNVACLFVGLAFDDEISLDWLYKFSLVSIILNFVALSIMGLEHFGIHSSGDAMGLAYTLLPHLLIVYSYFIKNPSIVRLFFVILAFGLIMSCGTRGPIGLALAYFVFAYIFLSGDKIKISHAAIMTMIVGIIITAYVPILTFIGRIIDRFGMSTRFIDKMLAGTITDDNGRDWIKSIILDEIHDNPYGLGVAADRAFISSYSHHIVYELCISYGVIIGIILFLIIVAIGARGYLSSHDLGVRIVIAILAFGGGFLKLFVSSSYLHEWQFWFLLGICITSIRQNSYGSKIKIFLMNKSKKLTKIVKSNELV